MRRGEVTLIRVRWRVGNEWFEPRRRGSSFLPSVYLPNSIAFYNRINLLNK